MILDSINAWENLSLALRFYQAKGYQFVDVPWLADEDVLYQTMPRHFTYWGATRKYNKSVFYPPENLGLVGSAEQGFIQLLAEDNTQLIEHQRYVSITPCFREEDKTPYNHPWFMKVELFTLNEEEPEVYALELMHDARECFHYIAGVRGKKIKTQIVDTEFETGRITNDINLNGIEIGSYGFREIKYSEASVVYGTGLAEPRFSQALLTM